MDDDHVSGVIELLSSGWTVGSLVMTPQARNSAEGRELEALASSKGAEVLTLTKDQIIQDKKVILRCLNPKKDDSGDDMNEASMVLELSYGDFSLLFTGDIGFYTEERILTDLRKSSLLKVSHHGSKGGTGNRFLDKVQPQAAIVSCSEKNLYGHPHPDTLKRLYDVGCNVYMTMDSGAISVTTRGKNMRIRGFLH